MRPNTLEKGLEHIMAFSTDVPSHGTGALLFPPCLSLQLELARVLTNVSVVVLGEEIRIYFTSGILYSFLSKTYFRQSSHAVQTGLFLSCSCI